MINRELENRIRETITLLNKLQPTNGISVANPEYRTSNRTRSPFFLQDPERTKTRRPTALPKPYPYPANNDSSGMRSISVHSTSIESIFHAISEKLTQVDLRGAGALLYLVVSTSCPDDTPIDGQFQCIASRHGPDTHKEYLKLYDLFVNLGGLEGGFFTVPPADGGNTPTGFSVAGGSFSSTGNNNKGGPGSSEETVFRSTVQPVTNLIEFGSDDLSGMEEYCKKFTEVFVIPRAWKNMFSDESTLLLYGPPGTGKTQLVKGVVGLFHNELPGASVQLFASTGASLKGKYVGETEKRMTWTYRELQRRAEENSETKSSSSPSLSILFLDEIEALAGDRYGPDLGVGQSSTVTTLLQLLEGVDSAYSKVLTIGATNLPWKLDPAITRRFTTKIFVDVPGDVARFYVIRNQMIKRIAEKPQEMLVLENKTDLSAEEERIYNKALMEYQKNRELLSKETWLENFSAGMAILTGYKTEDAKTKLVQGFTANPGYTEEDAKKIVEKFVNGNDHTNETKNLADAILEGQTFRMSTIYEKTGGARYTFGLSTSEINLVVNKSLNKFALMRLQAYNEEKKCQEICSFCEVENDGECKPCKHVTHKHTMQIGSHILKNGDDVHPEFLDCVKSVLEDTNPTTTDRDYVDMVFYSLTNKKPREEYYLNES